MNKFISLQRLHTRSRMKFTTRTFVVFARYGSNKTSDVFARYGSNKTSDVFARYGSNKTSDVFARYVSNQTSKICPNIVYYKLNDKYTCVCRKQDPPYCVRCPNSNKKYEYYGEKTNMNANDYYYDNINRKSDYVVVM